MARADDLNMYVDAFLDYREAVDNIRKNGNIVSHPRTGSPMENPYIKVRAAAQNSMQKIKRVRVVDALWGEGGPGDV